MVSKSNYVKVTLQVASLKKSVSENLVKSMFSTNNTLKDSYGKDQKFYEDLGIEPPEDFNVIDEEDSITIDLDDIEVIERSAYINVSKIKYFSDSESSYYKSSVYFDDDTMVNVKETVRQLKIKIDKVKKDVN